jgi:hypothetical protein
MINLDDKLAKILQTLSDLENSFEFDSTSVKIIEKIDLSGVEECFRQLNFEANDFFENLSASFDISNEYLEKIIKIVARIINKLDFVDGDLFELKINLLNFQIFMIIHILFTISSYTVENQITHEKNLEILVEYLSNFDQIPKFDIVLTLSEKHILDNHLRILGSTGDLYYLLSSNLTVINSKNLIFWATKCFKFTYLLDLTIDKFNPFDFYNSNNLSVPDFYREIVGHYTILGNTNATNLIEYLIGLEDEQITSNIESSPYIEYFTIENLLNKLNIKAKKIQNLIEKVKLNKSNNIFFSQSDDPINVISFRLMISLEKYFYFNIAKIKAYQKEYNQLLTPSSNELKNALELCEDWIQYTLSLTESNENILDTPFGGLFNSVFLEYLLLIALDDAKRINENNENKNALDLVLEKYKNIFFDHDPTFELISDFIYYKTYSQVYIYSLTGNKHILKELIKEIYSFIRYLENKPFLLLNALFLLIYLEIEINDKLFEDLDDLNEKIHSIFLSPFGLTHLKNEILYYLNLIEQYSASKEVDYSFLEKRMSPKILDINSWLIPQFVNEQRSENRFLRFISFHQFGDKIKRS